MQKKLASFYGLKAFALTGVRCVRLERGYLPQNHYQNHLDPIHEDKITDPPRKSSGPRRSPSPISVLTNGSFLNSYDDKKKMAAGRHSMNRSSSSGMLNDMMGRKYRRNSSPCLTSLDTSKRDAQEGLQPESRSKSLESLVFEASSVKSTGNSLTTEVTSFTSRSSIYQGHIGSLTLSQYVLGTSQQEQVEAFRRPKSVEDETKVNIMCFPEKKTSKRLFLLCFAIFVAIVILFLVSITSGWLFPGLLIEREHHHHDTTHTTLVEPPSNYSMTGDS